MGELQCKDVMAFINNFAVFSFIWNKVKQANSSERKKQMKKIATGLIHMIKLLLPNTFLMIQLSSFLWDFFIWIFFLYALSEFLIQIMYLLFNSTKLLSNEPFFLPWISVTTMNFSVSLLYRINNCYSPTLYAFNSFDCVFSCSFYHLYFSLTW